MSAPFHLRMQRYTMNMTYSKMMSYFNKEVRGRVKSFNYFRNGVQMMFGFVGKECSPIFAQRVTRTYRAFQLHSKLWSNFTKMNNYPSPRKLILGFVVTTLCQPQFDVIKYEDLVSHKNDLDYIHELTTATVICPGCKDRLVISKKLPNIKYCHCPDSEPVYNKKIGDFPWTPFVETADLIIWRQPHPKFDGLYTYKVYGYYDDISPLDFLATQLDLDYRKKWDNLVVELKVVDKDTSSSSEVVHWEMKWPKMFSNRDYCYVRRHLLEEKENMIIIMSKATKHPSCPEVRGVVRVNDYWSTMQIKPVKGMRDNGVEFGLTYFDNPGLSLPQWLTNWAAMAGIPDFLNKVRLAARAKKEKPMTVSTEKKKTTQEKKKVTHKKKLDSHKENDPEKKPKKISNPTIYSDNKEVGEVKSVPEIGKPVRKTKTAVKVEGTSSNQDNSRSDKHSNRLHQKTTIKDANSTSGISPAASVGVENGGVGISGSGGNSSTLPASTSSSTERGEILSQFFKQNFLTAPSS